MSSSLESLLGSVRIRELPRRAACRVETTTSLSEVYDRLRHEHAVAVLVYEGDDLVGIFTERDILNRTALEAELDRPIGDFMTREVVTVEASDRLSEAIRLMTDRHIRHLPLCEQGVSDGRLVGGRDVLRLIADYYPDALLNLPPRLHQRLDREEGG